jgi:hypothetical protein
MYTAYDLFVSWTLLTISLVTMGNTSQVASSSNATNQSQQQGQNNTNPLSNIPVLGKLFGGK